VITPVEGDLNFNSRSNVLKLERWLSKLGLNEYHWWIK